MRILAAFLAWGILFSTVAIEDAKAFDREGERAKMMKLIEGIRNRRAMASNLLGAPIEHQLFVSYFMSEVWPVISELQGLEAQARLFNVATDRALYNDEAEHQSWKDGKAAAEVRKNEILSSNEWKTKIKQFAGLASVLEGELPEIARRMWKEMELGQFDASTLPIQKRLTTLTIEINDIKNSSPVAAHLAQYEDSVIQIKQLYYSKQISFEEAWRRLEALEPMSFRAMGEDIATRGRALFRETAILRTKLAQSKHYDNWAQYRVAIQSVNHGDPFNTVASRIKFLNEILQKIEGAYRRFLEKRIATLPGMSLSHLRRSQYALLGLPDDAIVRDYLPMERALPLWREVMLESGFDPKRVDAICWDEWPRRLKHTHAYMENALNRRPEILLVDARTLAVPEPSDREMLPASIFIVQNFRARGPYPYKVALHEGGHGIAYSEEENPFELEPSNGWAETPSTLMEYFMEEPEFLYRASLHSGIGPLPQSLIEAFISNQKINKLMELRRQLTLALIDLKIWNYTYTENSDAYVDRAIKIYDDSMTEGLLIPPTKGLRHAGYNSFSTDHFFGGEVRYIGYNQASFSAAMIHNELLDRFERSSGRRSLMNQRTLGPILEGLFRKGSVQPFPQPAETFSRKRFSAESYIDPLIGAAESYSPGPHDFIPKPEGCGPEVEAKAI